MASARPLIAADLLRRSAFRLGLLVFAQLASGRCLLVHAIER